MFGGFYRPSGGVDSNAAGEEYDDDEDYYNNDDVPVFDPNNVNISFNGCGFLGIYHVGVAAALRAYLPNMNISVVCGASAGALAGVSLLGDVSPGTQPLHTFGSKPRDNDLEQHTYCMYSSGDSCLLATVFRR